MSNYHKRIMNIQSDVEDQDYESRIIYKTGHRDARHAAVGIALEAERETEELKHALTNLKFWAEGSLQCQQHPWDWDQAENAEECVRYADKLLEN